MAYQLEIKEDRYGARRFWRLEKTTTLKLETVPSGHPSRLLAKDSCILRICLASSQSINVPIFDVDLHREKASNPSQLFSVSEERHDPLG